MYSAPVQKGEFWGSQGGEDVVVGRLGSNALQTCR